MAPLGAVQETVRSGFKTPSPPYVTEEDKKELLDVFSKNGLAAPGRWYEVTMKGLSAEDDASRCYLAMSL